MTRSDVAVLIAAGSAVICAYCAVVVLRQVAILSEMHTHTRAAIERARAILEQAENDMGE